MYVGRLWEEWAGPGISNKIKNVYDRQREEGRVMGVKGEQGENDR